MSVKNYILGVGAGALLFGAGFFMGRMAYYPTDILLTYFTRGSKPDIVVTSSIGPVTVFVHDGEKYERFDRFFDRLRKREEEGEKAIKSAEEELEGSIKSERRITLEEKIENLFF